MSRKKNKKVNTDLKLIENKVEDNKMTTMERLSNILFNDCLKKGKNVAGCFENDKIDIMAYTTIEKGDNASIDDITCYIITPKSNTNVSVYVDNKTIDVTLGSKTSIPFNDKQLEFLVANVVCYINDFVA